jgi:hypothetical protein
VLKTKRRSKRKNGKEKKGKKETNKKYSSRILKNEGGWIPLEKKK